VRERNAYTQVAVEEEEEKKKMASSAYASWSKRWIRPEVRTPLLFPI
jgi:hypothetical protein